jgi:flagellar basal-body rod modification protein FlgD
MPISAGLDEINAGAALAPSQRVASRNTLGKDEFLTLLVTRLANQDPLSPVEDEAFIAQMAQFSQLEQLQNMNDNLQESISWSLLLSQTINNTMATSLLGRTIRVNTDAVVLDPSGAATVRYDLADTASDVVIEISNADGVLVRALRPGSGSSGPNEVLWDGLDAQGNSLPQGNYRINVRAEDGDGNPVTARAYFSGEVDSVRYIDGQALLNVDNVLVPLGDVIEVQVTEG